MPRADRFAGPAEGLLRGDAACGWQASDVIWITVWRLLWAGKKPIREVWKIEHEKPATVPHMTAEWGLCRMYPYK